MYTKKQQQKKATTTVPGRIKIIIICKFAPDKYVPFSSSLIFIPVLCRVKLLFCLKSSWNFKESALENTVRELVLIKTNHDKSKPL